MARSVGEIEKEIRSLGAEDKAALLRALIADLDGEAEEGVERAWLEEAQRRHREMKEGRVEAVRAEKVFEQARSQLEK